MVEFINALLTHALFSLTVLSRKSAHGRCILLSHQTGGWALFRVFPHSTLKERPPLFMYTSSAIAAIEQQARVSRPLNSHDPTVRLTISALLSRSHGDVLVSHGLLIN